MLPLVVWRTVAATAAERAARVAAADGRKAAIVADLRAVAIGWLPVPALPSEGDLDSEEGQEIGTRAARSCLPDVMAEDYGRKCGEKRGGADGCCASWDEQG